MHPLVYEAATLTVTAAKVKALLITIAGAAFIFAAITMLMSKRRGDIQAGARHLTVGGMALVLICIGIGLVGFATWTTGALHDLGIG